MAPFNALTDTVQLVRLEKLQIPLYFNHTKQEKSI